ADAGLVPAGRGRAEPDVVDRELVLAVGERLEPAPGVAGEPGHELGVGARQPVAISEDPRRPARQPGLDVGLRRLLTAERGLPGLLRDGDDDGARAGLDPAAHHLLAELAGLGGREEAGDEAAGPGPDRPGRRPGGARRES